MVTITHKGDFKRTEKFLWKLRKFEIRKILTRYAEKGIQALSEATPKDTGKTASSWEYDIVVNPNQMAIKWNNTNRENGVSIAMLLLYDHGTKNGGFVKGIDYINPVMKPIFEEMAETAWKEVTAL